MFVLAVLFSNYFFN
uniref:Photosystem II protein L n=4 Tax=Mesangiospermae TaxID=1437183 RepID=A0A7T0GFG0_CHRMO|nr:photosystem II protein L [Lindera glauca]YP_009649219.1 photosystem II protein L [Parasassafras confertiflorum]QMS49669.1 photosystem II protein L [Lindera erythrocarpa]QPJ79598.1 photosystem II protein L [Chrysanthemum x morifolium]UFH78650.1 photosystem II protein L [Artemisia lactiflora]USH92417.1 photosystem II protein L [Chrysanthemum indicum]UUA62951.1 Photosystem II reaction center protein L [Ammopiptanthus mongolicus]UYF14593.1 photosystem II protein L [Sorbus koehneana]